MSPATQSTRRRTDCANERLRSSNQSQTFQLTQQLNDVAKLKSAKHHWWPKCVSKHWAAEDGKTGWIQPDGSCTHIPPKHLGAIGNGHLIKLHSDPDASTVWDTSFEDVFSEADANFPAVISWLESLGHASEPHGKLSDRFIPQSATDDQLCSLTECAVSLAVRSPMNREASVATAEFVRGPIAEPERRNLIGLNMRYAQRMIADAIGANAKFVVLISREKEFIFGDGFFHNVRAPVVAPLSPKIVVPVTPTLSVVIARPPSYRIEPTLSTIALSDTEVDFFNHAVQTYSCQAIFFRSDRPPVLDVFSANKHLQYSNADNPIDDFIRKLPGVTNRPYPIFNTRL